jgi:hypothetical protein
MTDDTRETLDLDDGVQLRVEKTRPENQAGYLAVLLAETYDRKMRAGQDAEAFTKQEHNERVKAGSLHARVQEVLAERKRRANEDEERAANGLQPVERMRMDPIVDFDVEICLEEKRVALDRAQQFRQEADNYRQIVAQCDAAIPGISARIRKANEFARSE